MVLIDTFGCRAESAAKALVARASASVCFVDGGLKAWVAAGLPTTGDAAAALAPAVLARLSAAGEGDAPRGFSIPFRPKLLDVLAEGYTAADAQRDVLAGLSVGIIALSLSMALGIASDATPGAGLVTAVAAGFFVSLLGGSRVAIGGPTAAFIPIVVGVSHKYGIEGLSTCTVLSGGILMVMGALKLGKLIIKIPKPVITGCACDKRPLLPSSRLTRCAAVTAGIAVFIFSTQLKECARARSHAFRPLFRAPSHAFSQLYWFASERRPRPARCVCGAIHPSSFRA